MPLSPELEKIVYPEIVPYDEGFVQVSDLHKIYWQAYGNKDGIPVVCLHGGPGSGLSEWHARLYDPEKFHIILFDQRGAGKSTPHAELEENTTQHLIEDMEMLREMFGCESWNVFGGSWGSTLALAYADAHPERVRGLVVYGIFLCRESEVRDMYFSGGPPSKIYPDYFEKFLSVLPSKDRDDPVAGYKKLFTTSDQTVRQDALREWSHWEMRMLMLVPDEEMFLPENEDLEWLESHSKIERHYFEHHGFIDGNRILKEIGGKLKGKTVEIIQGRYDLICPAITAWELHKALPESRITFTPTSGHSGKNMETLRELMRAVTKLS